MCIAKRQRRERAAGGFTLVEMIVVLALVSVLSLIIERTLASANQAEQWIHAMRRVTERGQEVAYKVRDLVSASRMLLGDDPRGRDYLTALDLSRDPMAPGFRLPGIQDLGVLGPDDPAVPLTGNVLFFVREARPAKAVVDAASGTFRLIDTYRFVCIYPSVTSRVLLRPPGGGGGAPAWDLVIWRSQMYPSHAQLRGITDPSERSAVVRDLVNTYGFLHAWDATAPAASAFYALDNLGNVAGTPDPSLAIDEDTSASDRGVLVWRGAQLAPTQNAVFQRRSVFVTDPTWTPHGFEVKIVGPSGFRKVWMHMVVEVEARAGTSAVQPSTVIASTRDL